MSYKDNTNAKLKEMYKEYGLATCIKVAEKVLESEAHKDNKVFKSTMNGELCETVLELILEDFCNKNKQKTKTWKIMKGVILKDPDTRSNFLTELDLVLCTPEMIYIFECKSYKGDKTLEGDGFLRSSTGSKVDVYKQNSLHGEILRKTFADFRNSKIGNDIQLVMFDFSIGTMTDNRTLEKKIEMPCLNVRNVVNIFSKNDNIVKWDMRYVSKACDIITEKSPSLREKHISYVKSIHQNGNRS